MEKFVSSINMRKMSINWSPSLYFLLSGPPCLALALFQLHVVVAVVSFIIRETDGWHSSMRTVGSWPCIYYWVPSFSVEFRRWNFHELNDSPAAIRTLWGPSLTLAFVFVGFMHAKMWFTHVPNIPQMSVCLFVWIRNFNAPEGMFFW